MYANWPTTVLSHDKFRIERGPNEELLFRGPRWREGQV